jgi:hypothetical protein
MTVLSRSGTNASGFTGALLGNWWALLSGALSVPATFLALWFSNDIAKMAWGAIAFVSLWVTAYRLWKSEHDKVVERDQRKRQLLDEISALRRTMVGYRIDMEESYLAKELDGRAYQEAFDALEQSIATKIEQLSSKAEAITYRNRGNISRPLNPTTGGYLWPVLIDTCRYDIEYLKTFIHDYARGKERGKS